MNVPDIPTQRRKATSDSIIATVCEHDQVREIAQDFDREGRLLSLERCQKCGLLLRRYLVPE
jgi:hypothetical protein